MAFHTRCTTLTCCAKRRSLLTSDWDGHSKTSLCHLILGSIDIHTAPTRAKFSVKLLKFQLAETAQYVRQCSWCCRQGISLLITPATIWSPIYPYLWRYLVWYSGLFIFRQILIWSYSVAALSRIRDYTHTHTHFCPISWLFLFLQCLTACLTILCRFLSYKWHVKPILAASLSAATYSSSMFSCAILWSALVTKDCKQPQSSFELMWKEQCPYSTASSSSRISFFMCTWHTFQSSLLWCTACSQNFPLTSLPASQYIVHKMRRLQPFNCVSISIHHPTMIVWSIMNWNGRGSGHSLSEVLLQHMLEQTEKSQWKSVRLAGAMDKIHIRY